MDWQAFRDNGPNRRAWLDQAVSDFVTYITPPNLRPTVEMAAQVNPIQGIGDMMGDFGVAVDPSRSMDERRAAATSAAIEGLLALAPAAVGYKLGRPAAEGVIDALAGYAPDMDDALGRFWADEAGSIPVGRTDPVAQRGDEVLGLLSSGRGSEVTDEMLDMGDATLNARLNEYLFNNYDLPMDQASRMARAEEMGLTEDTIHGTTASADFTAFRQPRRYGGEVYVAPNTEDGRKLAAQFSTAEQGRVLPLATPAPLDTRTLGGRQAFEGLMDDAGRLVDFQMKGGYRASGLPGWGDQWAIDTVGEAGTPAMRLHERDWVDSTAVFDPANIRSRFARFDPRLSHLRNLSAGIGGAGLFGLLSPQEQQGGI